MVSGMPALVCQLWPWERRGKVAGMCQDPAPQEIGSTNEPGSLCGWRVRHALEWLAFLTLLHSPEFRTANEILGSLVGFLCLPTARKPGTSSWCMWAKLENITNGATVLKGKQHGMVICKNTRKEQLFFYEIWGCGLREHSLCCAHENWVRPQLQWCFHSSPSWQHDCPQLMLSPAVTATPQMGEAWLNFPSSSPAVCLILIKYETT